MRKGIGRVLGILAMAAALAGCQHHYESEARVKAATQNAESAATRAETAARRTEEAAGRAEAAAQRAEAVAQKIETTETGRRRRR